MNFIQENKKRWILVEKNIVSKGNVKFSIYFSTLSPLKLPRSLLFFIFLLFIDGCGFAFPNNGIF